VRFSTFRLKKQYSVRFMTWTNIPCGFRLFDLKKIFRAVFDLKNIFRAVYEGFFLLRFFRMSFFALQPPLQFNSELYPLVQPFPSLEIFFSCQNFKSEEQAWRISILWNRWITILRFYGIDCFTIFTILWNRLWFYEFANVLTVLYIF